MRSFHASIANPEDSTAQLQQSGAEVPADVAAEFYTSAALGLLVWWIDKDFCGDDAWMTGLYRKLAA